VRGDGRNVLHEWVDIKFIQNLIEKLTRKGHVGHTVIDAVKIWQFARDRD
jgi:hypothetical protein